MDDELHSGLRALFGFEQFRAGQLEALQSISERKDVLVIQSTGNGKSLLYQLPTLMARCHTAQVVSVVVFPLVSLMVDQCAALNARFGIDPETGLAVSRAACAGAQLGRLTPVACFLGSAQQDVNVGKRAVAGAYAFVCVTPEKITMWSAMCTKLRNRLHMFVVDECHCISSHGLDFRPAYRSLACLRSECPEVPIVALTATATNAVVDDITSSLQLRDTVVHRSSFDRPNLSYHFTSRGDLVDSVCVIARRYRKWCADGGVAIVYALTKRETESVAAKLRMKQFGIPAEAYHAGMDDVTRRAVEGRFRSGATRCVVATISFGMGIDKSDIRLVVHYGMSRSIDAYLQETGRAGRDGAPAHCLCLYSDADVLTHTRMANDRKSLEALRAMFAVTCDPHRCRRQRLLAHFDEAYTTRPCIGGCDSCDRNDVFTAATDAMRERAEVKLLRQVARELKRGAKAQIEFLIGKGRRPAMSASASALHGKGRHHSVAWWKELHRQMVNHGLLTRRIGMKGGTYYTV